MDLAGSIEFSGWDRPEIEVAGTADEDRGRGRSEEHRRSHLHSRHSAIRRRLARASSTRLVIHVPAKSTVSATLVSGDLKLSGVLGDVKLQTINGNLSGDAGGNLRASTVSGSVRMTARGAQTIEVKTINGDIQLASGAGEIEVSTVSGNAKIELGTLARGRFKSISGKLSASLSLAPGAQLEAESVSGTIAIRLSLHAGGGFRRADLQRQHRELLRTEAGRVQPWFGITSDVPKRRGAGPRAHRDEERRRALVHRRPAS